MAAAALCRNAQNESERERVGGRGVEGGAVRAADDAAGTVHVILELQAADHEQTSCLQQPVCPDPGTYYSAASLKEQRTCPPCEPGTHQEFANHRQPQCTPCGTTVGAAGEGSAAAEQDAVCPVTAFAGQADTRLIGPGLFQDLEGQRCCPLRPHPTAWPRMARDVPLTCARRCSAVGHR